MTEGRYPPDDMFKADFEGSRPPRKPSIKERMSVAIDSATSSLSSRSRRKTQVRHALPARPAATTPDATAVDAPATVIQHPTKSTVSRLVPVTPPPAVQAEEDNPVAQFSPMPPLVDSRFDVVELDDANDAPVEFKLQDPVPLTPPPTVQAEEDIPAPVTRRQTGAGMARWRRVPLTPPPTVQAEEDNPVAQFSPMPPLVDSRFDVVELDEADDAPVEFKLQDPVPLTPPPAVQADEDNPVAQASAPLAEPLAPVADRVVEQSPPYIVPRKPSGFVAPTSPFGSETDAIDGTQTDAKPASVQGSARRFPEFSPASRTEDKEWSPPEDSALFGYSTGDELQMPESPLERLRGVFRSISGRRTKEDVAKQSLYLPEVEALDAGTELVSPMDSPSENVKSAQAVEAGVVDSVPVDEATDEGGAESQASSSTMEPGHDSAMRSSAAGFLGRFRSPDLKARAKVPVMLEPDLLPSSSGEQERIAEIPKVTERVSSSAQSTASQAPPGQAPEPSVGASSKDCRKSAASEAVSGVSFSSLMASASVLIAKSRGGPATDSASSPDVNAPPPVPTPVSPASSPIVDAKSASDARPAPGSGDGRIPGSHYIPRHSASRRESAPTPPFAPAGEFEPPPRKEAASGPANRRSEAKSPPSMPFVPPRRDQARRRSNGRVVAGAISLGLIIVISVGVAKLNNSQSVKSTSTAPVVTAPPTTRVATTTPTTLRTSGVDSAPTTLPQPKSIVVATTTPHKSNTTLPATTTTKATAIANPAYAQITVRVANGTAVSGAAGKVTSSLKALGFNVVVPINATVSDLSTTTVYYYTGFSVAGQAVAQILGLPASAAKPFTSSAPLPSIYPSDVNVVLGTDVAS